MKAFKRKLSMLLAVSAMAFGVGLKSGETKVAKAAESVYKTALFGKNYNSQSVSSYTDTWIAANNGFAVSIQNANNNNNGWNYIRIGSKNFASIGKISTIDSIDAEISKIIVTVDSVTASEVNSTYLYVSSDSTFDTSDTKITVTISKGNVEYVIPEASRANDLYYQLVFDCVKGSSNGFIQISKVDYYIDLSDVSDEEKIQKVEDAITAIGTVEYTEACKAKIDSARSKYDALDESLKASVTNYSVLTNAETTYENLKNAALEQIDRDAAQEVEDLINNLPSVDSITDYSSNNSYVAAKKAYENLTETQKGYVGTEYITKLNAVGEKLNQYKPLMYEIDTNGIENGDASNISSVSKFEEIYPTPEGISWSGSFIHVYGESGYALKLGSGSNPGSFGLTLDDSKYYITKVEAQVKKYKEDISQIIVTAGGNTFTGAFLTSNIAIYDFDVSEYEVSSVVIGTTTKRAYVFGINIYYAEYTSDVDQAKIDAVIASINSIGPVTATLDSKDKIEIAELAYGNLKPEEQELVTNYSTLTTARTTFNSLTNSANEFDGISNNYNPCTIKAAGLNIDVNLAGNYNKIGINNAENMLKAITTENIASAIGVEASTTGIVTLHSYFYNGFLSLDLVAEDKIEGTMYYLTSSDGGVTYTKLSEEELNVETGKEINIAVSTSNITDLVVAFKLSSNTSNAQRMSLSSLIYCSNANAEDAETLIELIAGLDTCTEYNQAETCREFYNELSDYEKIVFSRSTVIDNEKDTNKEVSVNVLDKLMYMEYLAIKEVKSTDSGLNLFVGNDSNNVALILIVGLLGLSAVAAYYFLNKKKYSC